ncbi:hypothetical protein SAMN05519104_1056 [Rhizobiales bacterium GAS188]|nr:hypothetical protein SAMN05519104_1056 [Rhizobiales bacterium GAS188]
MTAPEFDARQKLSEPERPAGWLKLCGVVLASLALSAQAHAADLPAQRPQSPEPLPVVDQGLVFTATLYGWASGISGRVRTLPPLPAVKIDITFDKVLQNFNGAAMGAAELRSGRFLLLTDLIFAKIAPSHEFPAVGSGLGVKLDSTTLTGLAAAGYRVIDDPRFIIDGFAGVRGFYADNVLKLDRGALPSISYGKSEAWADLAVGARLRFNFSENWYASAIGFGGGAGARDFFWDLFGGVGYAFNDRYAAFAGYRVLKVDYAKGNFLYNVVQHGPVMGLNIRF